MLNRKKCRGQIYEKQAKNLLLGTVLQFYENGDEGYRADGLVLAVLQTGWLSLFRGCFSEQAVQRGGIA